MDKPYTVVINSIYNYDFNDRFEALDFAESAFLHQAEKNTVKIVFNNNKEVTNEKRN